MGEGSAPRALLDDSVSGLVHAVEIRHLVGAHTALRNDLVRVNDELRKDMARHFEADESMQKALWERLHKLEYLKFWIMGAVAVIVASGAILYNVGSRYLQLEVSAVVLQQVKAQTEISFQSLDSKIDSSTAFNRYQAGEQKRLMEEQIKRIETALHKR